jgi:beta-lactamase class A
MAAPLGYHQLVLAYYAENLETGRLLAAHDGVVMPSWSTIKVLLAAAFWRAVERGELDEAKPYAWQPWQAAGDPHDSAGVLRGFRHAAKLSLADLLHLALAVSDNDATNIVLSYVGLDAVNDLAAGLGLEGTAMRRRMMDAGARDEGRENVTCARDLGRLMAALVGDAGGARDGTSALSRLVRERVLRSLELTEHHDGLARYLPPVAVYAGKLGDDMPEGRYAHECCLVRQGDSRLAIVVMSDGGEGYEAVSRTGFALYQALLA